jgi:hypothetical protein
VDSGSTPNANICSAFPQVEQNRASGREYLPQLEQSWGGNAGAGGGAELLKPPSWPLAGACGAPFLGVEPDLVTLFEVQNRGDRVGEKVAAKRPESR